LPKKTLDANARKLKPPKQKLIKSVKKLRRQNVFKERLNRTRKESV